MYGKLGSGSIVGVETEERDELLIRALFLFGNDDLVCDDWQPFVLFISPELEDPSQASTNLIKGMKLKTTSHFSDMAHNLFTILCFVFKWSGDEKKEVHSINVWTSSLHHHAFY